MGINPAPWITKPRTEYPNGNVLGIWDADGVEIVTTDSGYYGPRIEDAQLIIAAPDLLTSLKAIVDATEGLGDLLYQALAAIDKAEGREPIDYRSSVARVKAFNRG